MARKLMQQGTKAALLLLSLAFALSCGQPSLFDTCGDEVRAESESPDGRYVATAFERNCGATTEYSTLVSLREAAEPFSPNSQGWVFAMAGQVEVVLTWREISLLNISAVGGEVFRQESVWRDIRIAYER